ncbi:MAG TPA: bifunctional phosphopantothenoylcysteine decarboxylase/phosphopantothenate--cysteine ligase CoaBC [Burkholderiaceae bacterium]|nr:bifunctional phosphopantothenoylcysteine decarboxylase/phosphopantothenate--cysteine ligase CoaBC [Burkholderiaceae bacterium]
MGSLANKRVLLGVTGGIAAYKSADLARRLRDAGAEVRVVMTQSANEFITPLTMQAVSGHPVYSHLLDTEAEAGMGHIDLARWADVILVAPASANFIARLTQGRAEDLLSAICLATQAPLAVAPAMNQQMWANPATQANMVALRRRGVHVFGPGEGSQACGEVGLGRMSEPMELVALAAELFASGELDGLSVVVTAGPTWEAIDPVRGISNKSSGKMGYAVAEAAMAAGARVILVSGPSALPDPERVTTVRVTSAQEMYDAVHLYIGMADVFIGVAAVADYRPVDARPAKIKKNAERMTLELVRNPDILESVARLEKRPFVVGFAAETDNVIDNARDKLERKNLDLVAANLVGVARGGFESDENQITLVERDDTTELPAGSKQQLARALVQHIAARIHVSRRTRRSQIG